MGKNKKHTNKSIKDEDVNTGWLFISAAPLSRTKISKPPFKCTTEALRRGRVCSRDQSKTKTNLSLLLKNDGLKLADLQRRKKKPEQRIWAHNRRLRLAPGSEGRSGAAPRQNKPLQNRHHFKRLLSAQRRQELRGSFEKKKK